MYWAGHISEYMQVHTCVRVCVDAIIIGGEREHDLKKSGDEGLQGTEEERKEKRCNYILISESVYDDFFQSSSSWDGCVVIRKEMKTLNHNQTLHSTDEWTLIIPDVYIKGI